jgi:hypothetical protein
MADEVEHVNKHPVFNLTNWARLVPALPSRRKWEAPEHLSVLRHVRREFRNLPDMLRAYADFVEITFRTVAKEFQQNPRYLDPQKSFEVGLLEYVRKTTGKPHFDQVALLLSAAFYATGREDVTVTPASLRQSWKRTPSHLRSVEYLESIKAILPSAR